MYFDRFDICAAWYHYLKDNHQGQWSDMYLRLCRLMGFYTPGLLTRERASLSENAMAILAALEARND